jgi:hypothetical protein
MPRIELFTFHYRDPRTGRWIRARYRAERNEIASRYAEFELVGTPEIREVDPDDRRFSPHSGVLPSPTGPFASAQEGSDLTQDATPIIDPASLGGLERFLLLVFLRRYVTYCARRHRYAAMNGAAILHSAIASA